MKSKSFLTVLTVLVLIVVMTGNVGVAFAGPVCDPAYVSQLGNLITVNPTGVNDTANLQCAFDVAVARGAGVRVQLSAGAFHTSQIVVNGFRGTFAGNGMQNTLVTNLPNMYVTPVEFYLYPPSVSNPWPSLFAFVGGDFAIAALTIQINGDSPTTGWTVWGIDPPIKELCHAVVLLGNETHARVDRILLEGENMENSLYGYNLLNGLAFMGFVGQPPWPPITGSFQVYNSTFRHISASSPISNVSSATVSVSHNSYEDTVFAMDAADVENSTVEFSHNKIVDAVIGFDLWNFFAPEYIGATFLITNNVFKGEIGVAFEQTFGDGNQCLILGNNTQNVTGMGIYLGPGTTGCTVVGGSNKTQVVDLGTGNILTGVNNMRAGVGQTIQHFLKTK